MKARKLLYPLRYFLNYALGIFNYFCMAFARLIANDERLASILLMQQLEWKPCKSCGWQFFFHAPCTEDQQYCTICSEHIIFYKCIDCDRKIIFDNRRKDVKAIDAMFCEYHIDDAPQDIISNSQTFIDFRSVKTISNEKVYSAVHQQKKEDFNNRLTPLPEPTKEQIDEIHDVPPNERVIEPDDEGYLSGWKSTSDKKEDK